jgi:hypothetical protein
MRQTSAVVVACLVGVAEGAKIFAGYDHGLTRSQALDLVIVLLLSGLVAFANGAASKKNVVQNTFIPVHSLSFNRVRLGETSLPVEVTSRAART